MADAGVGDGRVRREKKQLFVSCFRLHEGKERGGDLRSCLYSIQKFIARRRRKRVLRRMLPLTKWHTGAVEELRSGCVSVDPEAVTNRFL